jgi:hypothetical protein
MPKGAAQRLTRHLIVLGFPVEIRQRKSGASVEFLATLPRSAKRE